MNDFISKKQMIPIREFLENYCMLKCHWKGKMTHKRMSEFLALKGRRINKGKFGDISKEQKLTGDYLYVEDEIGQIIPYKNPTLSLEKLYISLAVKNDLDTLREMRIKLLKEEHLTYDEFDNVITIEEYERRKQIEQSLIEEERQDRLADEEYNYYEKLSKHGQSTKVKYYNMRRKCI